MARWPVLKPILVQCLAKTLSTRPGFGQDILESCPILEFKYQCIPPNTIICTQNQYPFFHQVKIDPLKIEINVSFSFKVSNRFFRFDNFFRLPGNQRPRWPHIFPRKGWMRPCWWFRARGEARVRGWPFANLIQVTSTSGGLGSFLRAVRVHLETLASNGDCHFGCADQWSRGL